MGGFIEIPGFFDHSTSCMASSPSLSLSLPPPPPFFSSFFSSVCFIIVIFRFSRVDFGLFFLFHKYILSPPPLFFYFPRVQMEVF